MSNESDELAIMDTTVNVKFANEVANHISEIPVLQVKPSQQRCLLPVRWTGIISHWQANYWLLFQFPEENEISAVAAEKDEFTMRGIAAKHMSLHHHPMFVKKENVAISVML